MCGLTGFRDVTATMGADELAATVERMAECIRHRGPDDGGSWVDERCGLALASRRLAIVDLSVEGHQPMVSEHGRYVVAFNGEVYNHAAIRAELLAAPADGAPRFRGHSDTEVLLAAIERWGLVEALGRCVGMFAFALWDREARTLSLVRDRLGEKPLYYGWMGDTLLFGSELKALRAHPAWRGEVDRDALALYVRHNVVPAPWSIYRGIRQLTPGTVVTFADDRAGSLPDPVAYWSMRGVAEDGAAHPFAGTEREATDELERLLDASIAQQMVADVPVGAFLSGGVDSSTVVALMQRLSPRPVRTFTVGFSEREADEAAFARAVAGHLGTDHTELHVAPSDAMEVIPKLPALYDEPFADSSQIPTYLVSRLARRHVTVSLSGDAGDELFGGYDRYLFAKAFWGRAGHVPAPIRQVLAGALTAVPIRRWDGLTDALGSLLPARIERKLNGNSIHALGRLVSAEDVEALHRHLMSEWPDPAAIVLGGIEPATAANGRARLHDLVQRMTYLDLVSFLRDDILVKVDRASMGVSLETRVPLLDHRVVEFAASVPTAMKVRDGQGKWLLRQVLYRHVPRALIERPKMGFGPPLDQWVRGPLRPWAEELLDGRRLREDGYFDPAPIRRRWEQHQAGGRNWIPSLWGILMFQAWLDAGG